MDLNKIFESNKKVEILNIYSKQKICETSLNDVITNDLFTLFSPSSCNLDISSKYLIIIKTQNCLYELTTEFTKKEKLLNNIIFYFKLLDAPKRIQRRSSFRINLNAPINFDIISNKYYKSFKMDIPLLSVGTVKNISVGGVKFESNKILNINDTIQLSIELKKTLIKANAIIIKTQILNENIFTYIAQITYLPKKDETSLTSYIFEKQRMLK